MKEDTTKPLSKVIRIGESEIRDHLDDMVKGTVEEAQNAIRSGVPRGSSRTVPLGIRV